MAIKTYQRGDNAKLSENFRVSEFLCKGSGCCTEGRIDDALVKILQSIRDHFGKKVYISSAYRCAAWNKKVGGVSGSYHLSGRAADIKVEDAEPAEVAKYAESIGVKGIGLYETDKDGHFVHIDTRTTKSYWYGQKQEKRTTFGGAPVYTLEQFVRDVQSACGATVDGAAGAETLAKTVTVGANYNRSHGVIKAIQGRLLALGYEEVGTADGVAGAKFASALAHFQQDNGCTPTGIAEEWGKTWQKLLGVK